MQFIPEVITVVTDDGFVLGQIDCDAKPIPEQCVYVFAPADNLHLEQDDLVFIIAKIQELTRIYGAWHNRPLILDDCLSE